MGHDQQHGPELRAGARFRGRLLIAFLLAGAFMLVEFGTALATRSLTLLSDAGHMLTDTVGLGLALAAVGAATTAGAGRGRRTFGLYRLEVLAALANALLLFGVAGYVIWQAVRRLAEPLTVPTTPMLIVAIVGLALNLVSYRLLQPGAAENLNVRGAATEVLADAVGSAAVLVAALLMRLTGADWVDPVFAIALGLWILPRAARLAGQALRVLVQAAPPHVDLPKLRTDLAALPGVIDVHDLHVWTLTSEMEVATAHLKVASAADTHRVLDEARVMLRDRHRLEHATLQVEPADHVGCEEVGW
ncbi:MAG: cation diffusion facilitator family transporter [Actinomycetes bacterium]|jgi:cobalt-zinc-cadmium efflux system protein|nr:cation diffusion facilitator family transporter [Actinomycetes bacterium]